MRQLSGMDASFVYLEGPRQPMHIGSIAIYDPSTAPGGKVTFKGILEHIKVFRRYEKEIDLKPILDHLATYPPLERTLSLDVEAKLPDIVGTLAMLAGQALKIIDPDVENPGRDLWDRVLRLMELLL